MPDDVVVMGDMNFGPGTPEYDRLIGGFAPGYGRLTNRRGLLDAWVLAGHEETSGATHPFVSSSLADRVSGAWVDQEAKESDHWPVWVNLDTF